MELKWGGEGKDGRERRGSERNREENLHVIIFSQFLVLIDPSETESPQYVLVLTDPIEVVLLKIHVVSSGNTS